MPVQALWRTGVAAVIAGALVALAAASERAPAQDEAAAEARRPPIPVETVEARFETEAVVLEYYPGLAAARRESRLGFEAGGRVASVSVDVGDRVDAGAELAALDLRTLDAQIAALEAQSSEAAASERLARATLARQRELVRNGHASEQALDEAQANIGVAEARTAAVAAQLVELRVRRELAVLNAPFAGVVTARHLDEGAIAAPGGPVIDLVETGAVEIRVGLPLERARTLEPQQISVFRVDGREVRARLRASTGVVDRASQTVASVFDVVDGEVAPGEVVRLAVEARLPDEGYWVPITALRQAGRGLWSVLALGAPDAGGYVLEARVVDVLYTQSERVFVRGALADGELIAASGLDRVTEGMRAIPVDTPEAEALAAHDGARGGDEAP